MSVATAYATHASSSMLVGYHSALAYNNPALFAIRGRPTQELYTYVGFGTAEPCILHMPNHLRLARSRPPKRPRAVAVSGMLDEASSVLSSADVKTPTTAYYEGPATPRSPSPSQVSTPISASYRTPTPDEIVDGARAKQAAEDDKVRAFYEKNPALAALRPFTSTQLPTPPSSPGSDAEVLPVANLVQSTPRSGIKRPHRPSDIMTGPLTPPTSPMATRHNNRFLQAPMTPPESPTMPRRSRATLQTMKPLTQRSPTTPTSPSKIPRRAGSSAPKSPRL
ncbi:hypothetical protein K525DRAFT_286908 [Schizophyllum commune Loenen D]|nr:hypothetical protein K525DRAFT_286908 [Schizophyllum commune Loenen D]